MRALLLGFGNVGRRLAEILTERDSYPGLSDLDVSIVGITTGSREAVVNPTGLDLRRVLAATGFSDASWLTSEEALQTLDYDVAVDTLFAQAGVIRTDTLGELLDAARVLTDQPDHLATVKHVFVGEPPKPMRLLGVREHGDLLLIRLEGITTPEQAKELSGKTVKIRATDARPLEDGEYFLFQLIGLAVEDEAGTPVGTVSDLIETGAHDVLVIVPANGGQDILVPNHPEYVLEMVPEAGRLVVRLPVYES